MVHDREPPAPPNASERSGEIHRVSSEGCGKPITEAVRQSSAERHEGSDSQPRTTAGVFEIPVRKAGYYIYAETEARRSDLSFGASSMLRQSEGAMITRASVVSVFHLTPAHRRRVRPATNGSLSR